MANPKKRKSSANDGAEFRLSPKHSKLSFLGWFNKETGDHVNLVGDETPTKTKATSKRPSKEVTYRAATQDDLRAFYELGSQRVVIKVDGSELSESGEQGT